MEKQKLEIKEIFNELKKGNKKVIEDLYKKYYKMVYGVAFSILKNKEDSEDIVQIVFSKLYEIDKEKMPKDKEATWLYAVIKNETLMFLRKKKYHYDIETVYNIKNDNNELDKIIDKESYNQLINKLNNKEKEIVSLKILANLSFEQISILLGEPTGTIKWRYYKAIYTLKIMLSNLGMSIITFIPGIFTIKQTKKGGSQIIKSETREESQVTTDIVENQKGSFENNISNNTFENTLSSQNEQILENIGIPDVEANHSVNYLGYGLLSISAIFFIITIIFSIILKKYQLKLKRKTSK